MFTVGFIGLGLIGGSMAKSTKTRTAHTVYGIDLDVVKDIKLASLTIPVDNEALPHSMWSKTLDLYGYTSSVLECNLTLNAQYLQNALGMETESK